MNHSLHYLLMADHAILQKNLFADIKDFGLSIGQPKVLDFLKDNNGAMQKVIAKGCHIEPASLSTILSGMEKNGLIQRQLAKDNRRNIKVSLTDKGWEISKRLGEKFSALEEKALTGLNKKDTTALLAYLTKIHENLEN